MSFNNRSDLTLPEKLVSRKDYMKMVATCYYPDAEAVLKKFNKRPPPSQSSKFLQLRAMKAVSGGVTIKPETPLVKTYNEGTMLSNKPEETVSSYGVAGYNIPTTTPPSSSSVGEEKTHEPLSKCHFVSKDLAKHDCFNISVSGKSNNEVKNSQVPYMSKEIKSASTEQYKAVINLVKDEKSDKRDLISAMESVLATLKLQEAKKQEDSTAKAQAALDCDDSDLSRAKRWTKMIMTHWQLDGSPNSKESKARLTDEAKHIETDLLLLLKNEKDMFTVLNDMGDNLNMYLSKVKTDEDMTNAELIEPRETADYIDQMVKETQASKVEAQSAVLQGIIHEYQYEVDRLKRTLDNVRDSIIIVKKEFDEDIKSASIRNNYEKFLRSSGKYKGSEEFGPFSQSASLHGTNSSISVQESKDVVNAVKNCKLEIVSEETGGFESDSEVSDESEYSSNEFQVSEESEYSSSESESNDNMGDPSEEVSSQNIIIPTENNETKTLDNDDWDLCDISDADA